MQPSPMLKRVVVGKLDGGKTTVFVASAVGDTSLVTDVYTLIGNKFINVTLTNKAVTGIQTMRNYNVYADDIYEFHICNNSYIALERITTVYTFTGQGREKLGLTDNRFLLHKTEPVMYVVPLEEIAAVHRLTQENAVYSFRFIQYDWKTGET